MIELVIMMLVVTLLSFLYGWMHLALVQEHRRLNQKVIELDHLLMKLKEEMDPHGRLSGVEKYKRYFLNRDSMDRESLKNAVNHFDDETYEKLK